MAVDWDALVLGPCLDTFGVPATYMPLRGASFSITGVFDRYHVEVTLDPAQGVPVSTLRPIIGVRDSVFATQPAQGDKVLVAGATFEVIDTQPDGHGHTILKLKIAR